MKLSLIAQARGWCSQNKFHCRRWASQRFYSCNSENDDELNNTEPSNESLLRQEPLKKKRVSSLTDLQSRLSLLEANMLKALQESEFSRSKEMSELRAEVAKFCNSEAEEKKNRLLEKLYGLMDLNCISKDVRNTMVEQTAVEEIQDKVVGVDAKVEMLHDKITWPIGNAEMLKSDDCTLLLRLQTGLHEVAEKMETMQKVSRELHEEVARKMEVQHGEVGKYLPKDVAENRSEQLHEDDVKDMEDLSEKVVKKMEELCKESKKLQEKVASMALEVEMLKSIRDFDGLGEMLKLFEKVEGNFSELHGRCNPDVLGIRFLCLEAQLPLCTREQIVGIHQTTGIWFHIVGTIVRDIKDLSETSKQLQLVTKREQEPGVKHGASYVDKKNYPAKIEVLMQGMQEELQGLRVLLALSEKEESAHRVTVDNQQNDSSKRIWEELKRLQCGMIVLEHELRDCMEPIKRLGQKQVHLEATSGKVRADVVLVTISSALLACSTAVCAWTLKIW